MKKFETLALTGVGDSKDIDFKKYPKGKQCEGIKLRCRVPVKNISAGPYSPTAADFAAMLDKLIGALELKGGQGQRYLIYSGAKGSEMRTLYRLFQQSEVPTWNETAAATFIGTSIAAAAVVYVDFDLFIPFAPHRFKGTPRKPGSSQMSTLYLKLDVATDTNVFKVATLEIEFATAAAMIDVVPVDEPGPDQWVPWLSYRKINEARLGADGVDGLTFFLFDANAAYAATALTSYSLKIGDAMVHENVKPAYTQDEWSRDFDQGGSDPTDAITLLHFVRRNTDLDKVKHGVPHFEQYNQDLATIELRQVYYPALHEEAGAEGAAVAAQRKSQPVLASKPAPPAGALFGVETTLPIRLHTPDDHEYHTSPGILGMPNGHTELSIPPNVQHEVKAAVAMASSDQAKAAMLDKARKVILARIPGGTNSNGAGQGPARAMVHELTAGIHG